MGESFTRDSIRQKHRQKIKMILNEGGGVDEIVNYMMSRISTVISYEHRKNERNNLRKWSENYGKQKSGRDT